VKRRRFHIELSERQQLLLGILVVILFATSMLYCLGLASLALRHAWANANLPWSEASPFPENPESPTISPDLEATPATPATSPEPEVSGHGASSAPEV
jgi:hypothetical protein